MDPWQALTEIAAQQHGRVHIRQAEAAGIAASTLRDAAKRMAWRRPLPGVFVLPGAPTNPLGVMSEAVLAVGAPVLIAGWSAAWLLGLVPAAPTTTVLLVAHQRRTRGYDRVLVHRSRTLIDEDVFERDGLPVTAAARTLCDLAPYTDEAALRGLIIDARQRGLVTIDGLARRAALIDGTKGLLMLRRLLHELDGQRCDSVLEWKFREALAAAGLHPHPEPVAVAVGGRVLHVDIGWPELKVGLEIDGFASHSDRRSLERDADRHSALTVAGWDVLRATWSDLGPDLGPGLPQLLARLRALLARPAA